MAGLIQTALSNILTTAAGGTALVKHIGETKQPTPEQALETAQKEAESAALENQAKSLGASPESARAYRIAQEQGITRGENIIFDRSGAPLATHGEMATLIARQNLTSHREAAAAQNNRFKARLEAAKAKGEKANG